MMIRETKTYTLTFSAEDAKLIDTLIREQVGSRTIESILNDFSYVFNTYRALFTLIPKVYHVGNYVTLDYEERNVLTSFLSKAYNDGKHEELRDQIKEICDAIDVLRR